MACFLSCLLSVYASIPVPTVCLHPTHNYAHRCTTLCSVIVKGRLASTITSSTNPWTTATMPRKPPAPRHPKKRKTLQPTTASYLALYAQRYSLNALSLSLATNSAPSTGLRDCPSSHASAPGSHALRARSSQSRETLARLNVGPGLCRIPIKYAI